MAREPKEIVYVGDSRVRAERRPNIPRDYDEYPGKTEAFMPDFLLKEWMVAAVFLVGFMLLVILHPAPLEEVADPTNTAYTPLPDWYFLFLYQLLKYPFASGPFVVVGTVIIPGIAFGALLLAPWLDRSPHRRALKRPIASGVMLLSLAAIIYLTWAAVAQHEAMEAASGKTGSGTPMEKAKVELVEPDSEAAQIFASQSSCTGCHGANLQGGMGPSLLGVGDRLSAEEIADVIKNGRGAMPPGAFTGSDAELNTLVEWLAKQKANPEAKEEK